LKFSIITPTYNACQFLERAIKSVLEQDYTNWEHIVVDGESTDGTVEILKKYEHVKWISEKDKGIYDAMNKGINMTDGDLLYFMGADDFFYDNQVLSDIEKEFCMGYDIVYGDVESPHFQGRYDGPFDLNKILKKNICHQSIFLSKRVFKTVGQFNTKFIVYADWDHNLKWFLNDNINIQYIDRIISNYGEFGFSRKRSDYLFKRDIKRKALKYGFKKIPSELRVEFALDSLKYSWKLKLIRRMPYDLLQLIRSYLSYGLLAKNSV